MPIIVILFFLNFLIKLARLFTSKRESPWRPPEAALWTNGEISHELDFFLTINETPAAFADLIHEPKFRGS